MYAGYSTDPVHDAGRHYDAMQAQQEQNERAERILAGMFLKEVTTCGMHSDSELEAVADWQARAAGIVGANKPATVGQVMAGALGYGDGPSMDDAMSLIISLSKGEATQQQAKELLQRMAQTWAKYQVMA